MITAGRPVLITGGAGFIGANLADRLLRDGHQVVIFDNLSRPGAQRNLRWLRHQHGDRASVICGDVRDGVAVEQAVSRASQVYHLAAQAGVSGSLTDPITDFDVNARGTVNVLEGLRRQPEPPPLLHASTSKVYGPLDGIPLRDAGDRYEPRDPVLAAAGIAESHPLDFHTPYGCSKGAADQYVIDYARTWGLPAAVFRLSCIYGPHQFGNERQGWIAHFILRALDGQPIEIRGEGKELRDVLFVDDLVDAMVLAQERIGVTAGRAFNIGGGPEHTLSARELLQLIEELGVAPRAEFAEATGPAQRYYVSDTSLFGTLTGWRPRTGVRAGVERLYRWVRESGALLAEGRRPAFLALAGSDARG